MADIYLAITAAATVHFAQPDALKVTRHMNLIQSKCTHKYIQCTCNHMYSTKRLRCIILFLCEQYCYICSAPLGFSWHYSERSETNNLFWCAQVRTYLVYNYSSVYNVNIVPTNYSC